MQNVYSHIYINRLVKDEHFLWVLGGSDSLYGLFQIDRENEAVHFLGLPIETAGDGRGFADMIKVGQKIYLIPKESRYLVIYDVVLKQWKRILLEDPLEENIKYSYKNDQWFVTAISYEKYIYLFPDFYPTIVRYDVTTERAEYLYDCMKLFDGVPFKKDMGLCLRVFVEGDKAFFYAKCYGLLLQFNLKSGEIKILEDFGLNNIFCVFEDDGSNYWFVPRDKSKPIIKYNKKERKQIEIQNLIHECVYNQVPFYGTAVLDGYLWLLPGLANMALKIEIDTGIISRAQQFNLKCSGENIWRYSFLKKIGQELYAYDVLDKSLVHYISPGICERKKYYLKADGTINLDYMRMSTLIEQYRKADSYLDGKTELQNLVGERIYRAIIQEKE